MRMASVRLGILVSLLGLLWGSGCYNAGEVNAFLMRPRSPVAGVEYRALPPDGVSIQSQHVPEINGSHTVGPDGKINIPLLGRIFVADMTAKEIEDVLVAAAKDYYEQADATVTINCRSQKYYVFGEVGGEGPHPYTGHDTLLDALSNSRPTDQAWEKRIIVLRVSQPAHGGYASKNTMYYRIHGVHPIPEDKPRYRMLFNLKAMTRNGDMANNILLKPDDIIYVQPHPIAWFTKKLRTILSPVSPVLEAVRAPADVRYGFEDIRYEDRYGDGRNGSRRY